MAQKRQPPYIWTTWLTGLLVGEKSCEYSAWFRSNYQNFTKVPSNFNESEWRLNHTNLLNKVIKKEEGSGKFISIENQNSFRLPGKTAILAGKPDLITTSGNRGTIIDVKTGQPSPSHHIQVMIYMYSIPKALNKFKGINFDGKVVYVDHEDYIADTSIDSGFIDGLSALIRKIVSPTPAKSVPSFSECRFCNISIADCPQRIDELSEVEVAVGTTDF